MKIQWMKDLPSIRTPMRRASVPVFGYLSFLASNSPITNDFTAFEDHLLPPNIIVNGLEKRQLEKEIWLCLAEKMEYLEGEIIE